MKYILLSVRLVILLFLASLLLFFLSDNFIPYEPRYSPPFGIFVIDTVNLFIHEAGHLVFAPFGFTIKLMGGSIFQVIFPLAVGFFWYRRDKFNAPYFLFWTGESIINASVYIGDAPYKRLRLISPGALHDWNTVFSRLDMMGAAEPISQMLFILGIVSCTGALAWMVGVAVYQFRYYSPPAIED